MSTENKKDKPLNEEQKKLLETFASQLEQYIQHRKDNSINGWYFNVSPDSFEYGHDCGYSVTHLPTDQTIELGCEKQGLMQSIRFLQAITNNPLSVETKDKCYDCIYYIPDEAFDEWDHFRGHGCRCYRLVPKNEWLDEYRYQPKLRVERMEIPHMHRTPCEFFEKRKTPIKITDYSEYDTLPNDWHELNSINDWSLFTYRKDPEKSALHFAKHIPTGNLIYMGMGRGFRSDGYENSTRLYHALIGKKDNRRTGCSSCIHFPDLEEDFCRKNHLIKDSNECDDYENKYRKDG